MTDHREVMRQALEAMEYYSKNAPPIHSTLMAIEALRAALDEKVEPVAWYLEAEGDEPAIFHPKHIEGWTPLYEHPPAPPASTDEDVKVAWGVDWSGHGDQTCVSIVKQRADGTREIVAVEYAPSDWPAQEGP
jgi:hypothetical protein